MNPKEFAKVVIKDSIRTIVVLFGFGWGYISLRAYYNQVQHQEMVRREH